MCCQVLSILCLTFRDTLLLQDNFTLGKLNYQKSPIFYPIGNCTLIQEEDSHISGYNLFWIWKERQFNLVRIYLELWRVECVSCGLVCEIFCPTLDRLIPRTAQPANTKCKMRKRVEKHISTDKYCNVNYNFKIKYNQINIALGTTLWPQVLHYLVYWESQKSSRSAEFWTSVALRLANWACFNIWVC